MTSDARRDSGGTRAAALLTVVFAVAMLGTTLPTPLYPGLAAEFDFGELTTTVVFAVYAVAVIGALLVCGRWSDQLGRKPMLLVALVLSAGSASVFAAAGSLGWLLAGRVLSGLSAGICTGTATAAIVDVMGERSRGRANLVAALANMGGLGLGPLTAGLLAEWAPNPLVTPFVVDLGLLAVAAACLAAVREPVQRRGPARLRVQRLGVPSQVRPVFLSAAMAGFAGFAVLGLFSGVSPAFLGEVLHDHSPALTGGVVVSVFAASLAGQLASVRLARPRAITVGCGCLLAGMVILAVSLPVGALALLLSAGVVAGFGQGLSFRAGLASVTEASPPERRGEIASAYFVVLYVAISIPIVGVGAAATSFGLVASGLVFAVLVGLLAGAVLLLLARRGSSP